MTARPNHVSEPIPNSSIGVTTSVVIVNFNGGGHLTECVRSIFTSTVQVDVTVVDNASQDDSIAQLGRDIGDDPRLRIIRSAKNVGFAAGNNMGLRYVAGAYVLCLNPDCVIRSDTIERMIAVMEADPYAAMAGCLIRNPDNSEQAGCRRFIPTPWRSLVRVLKLSTLFPDYPKFSSFNLTGHPLPSGPVSVEAISGAFMLLRRSAIDEVGLMDDGYFLHCEDLDWCMRFTRAGYKILFVPDVEIVHAKGASSADRPIRVEWHKHKGMIRFYRKFFWDHYPKALMCLVLPAVWTRFAAKAVLLTFTRKERRVPPLPIPTETSALMRQPIPTGTSASMRQSTPASAGKPAILVTGATSQVGRFLLPRLQAAGFQVHALSRKPATQTGRRTTGVTWRQCDIAHENNLPHIADLAYVIHLAPLMTLPKLIDRFAELGVRRIIAFGSTSRFTKLESPVESERALARSLISSEERLAAGCARRNIAWTVFRPTLIYGCAMDRNVTAIAKFVQRFGFFPMMGEGKGLRQPVHADDLAAACLAALDRQDAFNKAYNLSGGETLSYREMVNRIFRFLGRTPRFLQPSPLLFRFILRSATLVLPAYRNFNLEMANRMNTNLCFDYADATRDFGYRPRRFELENGLPLSEAALHSRA
jgi:GT2 family glycosyltransferase/nucleoside-diphosphate-sugar epimerase